MRLECTVVIPVGPGHGRSAIAAERSAHKAWANARGPFSSIHVVTVDDTKGGGGRSAARNSGVASRESDWYFFLDADDRMMPLVFGLVDVEEPATFGAVCLNGTIYRRNRWPVSRDTLFEHGADGTLSMGLFVRGDVARVTPFDESMDLAEDFDFYLRLPSFVKIQQPLVSIGYDRPSAGGPRGVPPRAQRPDWNAACRQVIERYRNAA